MISQIVVMAAGMITPRLMIATYGSEMNGLVSSLNQFISYITLVEAGIGGAAGKAAGSACLRLRGPPGICRAAAAGRGRPGALPAL